MFISGKMMAGMLGICVVVIYTLIYAYSQTENTPTMVTLTKMLTPSDGFVSSHWISLIGLYLMCDVHDDLEYSQIMRRSVHMTHISNKTSFNNIKNGDIVCLHIYQLMSDFLPNYLPKYIEDDIYFSIMTFDKPKSFPSGLFTADDFYTFIHLILPIANIVHIFVTDYDGTRIKGFEDKISGVPLGINYHRTIYTYFNDVSLLPKNIKQQERDLNKLLKSLLSSNSYEKRELSVYAGDYLSSGSVVKYLQNEDELLQLLSLYDSCSAFNKVADLFTVNKYNKTCGKRYNFWHEKRRVIVRFKSYFELRNNSFIVGLYNKQNIYKRKWAEDVYKERSKNMFVISPLGVGLDCYRTWEALVFGHIVIVQTSSLDELYDGLPVVIIDDWNEINEENLTKWANAYYYNGTTKNNDNVRYKLTTKYWYNKMKNMTNNRIRNK